MEKTKIKISPSLFEKFQEIRMPQAIMDKYYECDNSKPRVESEFVVVNEKSPWD